VVIASILRKKWKGPKSLMANLASNEFSRSVVP
jgi:hypothetical protein